MVLTTDDFKISLTKFPEPKLTEIIEDLKPQKVIEGSVYTTNFHNIHFRYYLSEDLVYLFYFDGASKKRVDLLQEFIYSKKDFERAINKADKKIYSRMLKD